MFWKIRISVKFSFWKTSDFSQWQGNSTYNKTRVRTLCREDSDAWPEISFSYFLQYVLHNQFKSVSDYARKNGVVLKGDLPIGVSRTSVEAVSYTHLTLPTILLV